MTINCLCDPFDKIMNFIDEAVENKPNIKINVFDDLEKFLDKKADFMFVDFGNISLSPDLPIKTFDGHAGPRYYDLIKWLEEHPSQDIHFMLTMEHWFYTSYSEIWELPNAILVEHDDREKKIHELLNPQGANNGHKKN